MMHLIPTHKGLPDARVYTSLKNIEIIAIPVDSLAPYARNARTHSDAQIAEIANSITEFGFTNPVLIDEKNEIIAGHGRVLAAKSLGLVEVPTICLGWLTDQQKQAYVLADNQLALNSGWDLETLNIEIKSLDELGFNIGLLGFSADDLPGLAGIGVAELEFPILPTDTPLLQQMTFILDAGQAQRVAGTIKSAILRERPSDGVNTNKNGNALAAICEKYMQEECAHG